MSAGEWDTEINCPSCRRGVQIGSVPLGQSVSRHADRALIEHQQSDDCVGDVQVPDGDRDQLLTDVDAFEVCDEATRTVAGVFGETRSAGTGMQASIRGRFQAPGRSQTHTDGSNDTTRASTRQGEHG